MIIDRRRMKPPVSIERTPSGCLSSSKNNATITSTECAEIPVGASSHDDPFVAPSSTARAEEDVPSETRTHS